jgi:hypothetical protein
VARRGSCPRPFGFLGCQIRPLGILGYLPGMAALELRLVCNGLERNKPSLDLLIALFHNSPLEFLRCCAHACARLLPRVYGLASEVLTGAFHKSKLCECFDG